MMVIKCIASVLIAGACLNVMAVRDVSVSYANKGTGRVNLAFGSADPGTENRLFAAWSALDRGATCGGWDEVRHLGLVKAETTAFSCRLPAEWTTQKGIVRFFLVDDGYDYRVEFCASESNGAYVDTAYKPTPQTEVLVEHNVAAGGAPFGVASYLMAFNNDASNFFCAYFGDSSAAMSLSACDRWCTTRIGPEGTFLDGEQVYRVPQTTLTTCDYSVHLFQRAPSDKNKDAKHAQVCSIRRAEIREGGTLVRRYVACVKDGVAGFYEAFEKKFLASVNGSALIAKGARSLPALEDAVASSVTAALAFGDRLPTVSAFDRATGEVTLTFPAGSAKQLFALQDVVDRGCDYETWSNACYVAEIDPAATSHTWTLPAAWRASTGAVRFVLMDPEDLGGAEKMTCLKSSNGGAYIETGIVPDGQTSMRMRFRANAGVAPFGVSGKFVFFCNSADTGTFPIFFGIGGSAIPNSRFAYSAKKVYTFQIGPEGALIDGVRYTGAYTFPTGAEAQSSIVLVGRRDDGLATRSKVGAVDIYSAYVETNGVPARSYVACVKDGQNVLYDRISKTFFANVGSGSFGVGEIAGPELLRENVKSVSAVLNVGPTVRVKSFDRKTGILSAQIGGMTGGCALYLAAATEDKGSQPSAWPVVMRLASIDLDGSPVDWQGVVDVERMKGCKFLRLFVVCREVTPSRTFHDSLGTYGSYFLNADVKADSSCEVEVEYSGSKGSLQGASCPFGLMANFAVANLDGNDFRYAFFGNGGFDQEGFTGIVDNIFHRVKIGPSGLFVDDNWLAGPFEVADPVTHADTLTLLRARDLKGSCTIRRFVMRQNGYVVRDMVPCCQNGVNGMWDSQTRRFFTNANSSGASVLGVEIFADSLTDDAVASVSDALKITPGLLIVVQ